MYCDKICICVDMLHDGELDQMASDLLIPKTTLKTYFQLV